MADRYIRANGNWTAPIWSASQSGTPGSASVPGPNDTVWMFSPFSVVVNADITVSEVYQNNGSVEIEAGRKLSVLNHYVITSPTSPGSRVLDISNATLELSGLGLTSDNTTDFIFQSSQSRVILNSVKYFDTNGLHNFSYLRINAGRGDTDATEIVGSLDVDVLDIRSANSNPQLVKITSQPLVVNNFIAVGLSANNKLRISGLTNAPGSGNVTPIDFRTGGTSYAKHIHLENFKTGTLNGVQPYIGAESTTNALSTGWILDEPAKISELEDDFSIGDTLSDLWTYQAGGPMTQAAIIDQQLVLQYFGGSSSYMRFMSADGYDIVDSEIYIDVDSMQYPITQAHISLTGIPLDITLTETETPTVYRFRSTRVGVVGDNIKIVAERNITGAWEELGSVVLEELLAKNVRLEITSYRNASELDLRINSIGVSPKSKTSGTFLAFFMP